MTRALVLARVFPPQVGGSGRFLWEIYRRQAQSDFQVAAGEFAASEAFDREAGLAIHRLPLDLQNWGLLPWGFPAYASSFRRILQIIRRERIGALHAATLLPEGLLALLVKRWAGLPYLSFVHGEEIPIVAGSRELSWLARRVLTGAAAIIANSDNTRRELLKRWPDIAGKVNVVTPGVDIDKFCPAAADAHVRQRLGWTARRVVLTAGRLQTRKGHDMLIRALPAIRRAVPDVLYAIVGAGEGRSILESLVDECGVRDAVRFHGSLADSDLIHCYQQCDMAALPNREVNGDFEGFGMVLVEAQACGRPVLAGMSGGTAETLRDGETGCLVDCTRPDPLAAAVIKMLGEPQRLQQMGAAARQWAVEQFDWRNLARRAQRVFDNVAAGANQAASGPAAAAATPRLAVPGGPR